MDQINSSNQMIVKLLEKLTNSQQQTHPSYDGVCDYKRSSQVHPSSDGTREYSPPRPKYLGGENQEHDFINHGDVLSSTNYYGSPTHTPHTSNISINTANTTVPSYRNLQKWSAQHDLSPHEGDINVTSKNKRGVVDDECHDDDDDDDDDNVSIHVIEDEFSKITDKIRTVDQKANNTTHTHTVTNPEESIFKKYIDEFQPELKVGPPIDIDLAEAVKYFANNQLESEKFKQGKVII